MYINLVKHLELNVKNKYESIYEIGEKEDYFYILLTGWVSIKD